jgi:hypothetical protein
MAESAANTGMPALPLTGGCLCRQVRYEVRSEPLTIAICHCTICQRRTGSAFSMSMPIAREGFALVAGATITRDMPGGSGKLLTQHFCEHCLVRTHTEPHVNRALVYVRPGTLDDTRWLQPAVQLWTDFGQRWALCDGVPSFDEGPTDPGALVRAYRERPGSRA